jgi:hypothetical protein
MNVSIQSCGQGISDGLSKFLMDNQVDSVSIKVDMLRDDAAQIFPARVWIWSVYLLDGSTKAGYQPR